MGPLAALPAVLGAVGSAAGTAAQLSEGSANREQQERNAQRQQLASARGPGQFQNQIQQQQLNLPTQAQPIQQIAAAPGGGGDLLGQLSQLQQRGGF